MHLKAELTWVSGQSWVILFVMEFESVDALAVFVQVES